MKVKLSLSAVSIESLTIPMGLNPITLDRMLQCVRHSHH
jgi:hypothetical protein